MNPAKRILLAAAVMASGVALADSSWRTSSPRPLPYSASRVEAATCCATKHGHEWLHVASYASPEGNGHVGNN